MKHIVWDTDIGHDADDAMAQLFAMRRPELKLDAIVTTYYDSHKRAKVAQKLARMEGYEVPIAAGLCMPLTPGLPALETFASAHEFIRDFGGEVRNDGVDLMIDTISKLRHEVYLACTGPLTNLATALRQEPRIVEWVNDTVVMGGNFGLKDADGAITEWNFGCDPVAADIVLESGLELTVIPTDATNQVAFDALDTLRLMDDEDLVTRLVAKMAARYFSTIHDPLIMAYLVQPSFFRTQAAKISQDDLSRRTGEPYCKTGKIIGTPGEQSRHKCVYEIDPSVKELFLNTVLTGKDKSS